MLYKSLRVWCSFTAAVHLLVRVAKLIYDWCNAHPMIWRTNAAEGKFKAQTHILPR